MSAEEKGRGLVREILSFLLYVAVVVGVTFLIIHFVGQRTYVSGSSMENTLSDGDNLIVDKPDLPFLRSETDMILLCLRISMKTIHILSKELSDFRVRPYRLWMEPFI